MRWASAYATLPTTSPPQLGRPTARVQRWFQEKKAGWYTVLADPQMPVTSTLLDQAHDAVERKLFAMKGFVRSVGSKRVLALREAARRQSCTSGPHEGARPSLSVQECQHIPQACDGSSTVCRGDQRRPLAASRRVSRLAGIYGQRKRRGDEPSCSSPSVRGGVAGAKTAQDRAPAAASTARPALPNTPAGAHRPTDTNHATWERSHPHQPSVRRVLSRRRGQPPAGGEKAARRSQGQESRPGYGDVGPVCCKGKRCGRGNAPTHRASP